MRVPALALLLAFVVVVPVFAAPVAVPEGGPPVVDGTLGEDEWKGALRVPLVPHGEAFLLRDDDGLYVGIRAKARCITSLTVSSGETVHVLHASASLGTAVYEKGDDGWRPTRTFTWRCRETRGTCTATQEERNRFLKDEGWLGTTISHGTAGQAEFHVANRLLEGDSLRFAIAVAELAGRPKALRWPESVDDGATSMNLLMGSCPKDLAFAPGTWGALAPRDPPHVRFRARLAELEALVKDDPVDAYVRLLDLLEARPALDDDAKRVSTLRRALEKKPAVRPEAKAEKRLASVRKWLAANAERLESSADARAKALKKLEDVQTRHPDTRAARVAKDLEGRVRP